MAGVLCMLRMPCMTREIAWFGVVLYAWDCMALSGLGLGWYGMLCYVPSPKAHPNELWKSWQILRRATQIWCDFGVPTEA